MSWKLDGKLPVSYQIAQKLRLDILGGMYPPGTQIPTVRQLAVEASVNPNTVQKALTMLEGEGLLVTQGTVGRFVTKDVSALDGARSMLRREFVRRILAEANELGMGREELICAVTEMEEEL